MLSKPNCSPIAWSYHRCKKTTYLSKRVRFPGGWFRLRLFSSGTLNVYVKAQRSGLDSTGLIDLLNRLAIEVHTFCGKYVSADELKLRGPTEENFDTRDPRFRKMLEVQGVKSIKTYSALLHCYLRIYEKYDRVRIETGGYPANATLLARALCTPVSAIENLAILPQLLDDLEKRLAANLEPIDAGISLTLRELAEIRRQLRDQKAPNFTPQTGTFIPD